VYVGEGEAEKNLNLTGTNMNKTKNNLSIIDLNKIQEERVI
jgi:hypothetical protein